MARHGAGRAVAPDLAADRAAALATMAVSRETLGRLDEFVHLLLKWQATTNLVAASTVSQVWTRHIADSLQLVALAPESRTWVDLGSGAGFPGVVVASVLAQAPGSEVHLVDSNGRKAAFLREAVRTLALPALVHAERIEEFVVAFDQRADIVTARALAPLGRLLGLAEPLLKRGAQGLFPKGQDVDAELTAASKCWKIEAEVALSKTSAQGRIVIVRNVERR